MSVKPFPIPELVSMSKNDLLKQLRRELKQLKDRLYLLVSVPNSVSQLEPHVLYVRIFLRADSKEIELFHSHLVNDIYSLYLLPNFDYRASNTFTIDSSSNVNTVAHDILDRIFTQ